MGGASLTISVVEADDVEETTATDDAADTVDDAISSSVVWPSSTLLPSRIGIQSGGDVSTTTDAFLRKLEVKETGAAAGPAALSAQPCSIL